MASLAVAHAAPASNELPSYMRLMVALGAYGVVPYMTAPRYLGNGRFQYDIHGLGEIPGSAWVKWDGSHLEILHVELEGVGEILTKRQQAALKAGKWPKQKKNVMSTESYYQRQKSAVRAQQKQYYEKEKSRIAAWKRKYRQENKRDISAHQRAYYQASLGPNRFPFSVRQTDLTTNPVPPSYAPYHLPEGKLETLIDQLSKEAGLHVGEVLALFRPREATAEKDAPFFMVFQTPGTKGNVGVVQWNNKGFVKSYIPKAFSMRAPRRGGKKTKLVH